MFSKFVQPKFDQNDSIVLVVKEAHWKSLEIIKQDNQLYLCQITSCPKDDSCSNTPIRTKYEIIFRTNKMFSLCRMEEFDVSSTRFNCLKNILNVVSQRANPYRRTSFITKKFQKIIDTVVDHPNWIDSHISAYNGFVDFFKKSVITPADINAQMEPDLCTPLHLAISQGFKVTMEAILSFNPNIYLLDSENRSILHYAVLSRQDILESLLQVSNVRQLFSMKNKKKRNPIEAACFNLKKDNLLSMMKAGLSARMLSIVGPHNDSFIQTVDNTQRIMFSKTDLEDLDLTYINTGGCPLHWAFNPRVIENLLQYGFKIDTPNLNDETALSLMCIKNRFKCALNLMFSKADPNKPDSNGDTPLHISVRTVNVPLAMALLVFDANVNSNNLNNQSPRHLAATGGHPNHKEILEMLDSIGAQRCSSPTKLKCSSDCLAQTNFTKSTEKSSKNISDNVFNKHTLNFGIRHRNMANDVIANGDKLSKLQIMKENDHSEVSFKPDSNLNADNKIKKIKMISFDGGGVKGLFTVQMMIELEKYLKHDLFYYFDWISGTSTGSMIAILLAQGRSLIELRKLYFRFKDQILTGTRPYSGEKLEILCKTELGANITMSSFLSKYNKYLMITATQVDRHPPLLHLFRSYSNHLSHNDEACDIEVWKAIRASSAAPTFFRSYLTYIDGGMVSNNPTLDSLTDFFRYQSSIKKHNRKRNKNKVVVPELELVLSFGTGQVQRSEKDLSEVYSKFYYFLNLRSSLRDLNRAPWFLNELASQVKAQVTNCNDHVVVRSNSWCSSLNILFYRINAIMPFKVSLNETNDFELIKGLWEVKLYSYRIKEELKQLAQVMDNL